MTTYKIIESPPYDKGAPSTFWIKKETTRFGFIKTSTIFGNYKFDSAYGELGYCPFFNKKFAEKRLKQLTK